MAGVKGDTFECPQCGHITDVLVCENNVATSEGGFGLKARTDGCGRCIDKYGVWYRIPVQEALAD